MDQRCILWYVCVVVWCSTLAAHPNSRRCGLIVSQFSDEFNTPGRTFYDDDDPYWQAMDFWYGVTQDLEVGGSRALPVSSR